MVHSFSYPKKYREHLPLTVDLYGFHHLQEPVMRDQSFPLFQCIYCEDGTGECQIRGQKMILKPGNMILIYPREAHSYKAISDEWHVHIIGFSGKCCFEILRALGMGESGVYHFKDSKVFVRYVEEIRRLRKALKEKRKSVQEQQSTRQSEKNVSSEIDRSVRSSHGEEHLILSQLCYEFLTELSLVAKYDPSGKEVSGNDVVQSIITYMEEHYQEPITLEEMAETVHLSKNYVSHLFKKEMQQSVFHYLNNYRMSQAKYLLIEKPEMRVAEIGKACGFDSPAYFGEMFKKMVGMTPLEFRMAY